ncbi:MAG: 50S ribosomal protein L4 [Anaerolineae bacterium]|nr:50S ribosomal protein L4 [Anaerolineae bacterium]
MKVPVKNIAGQEVDSVELPADIFEAPINIDLMHQAYVRQMANARQGTHKAKTRGEVIRSKAKWYRQKGTGRARHGSRNAPTFVGGGKAHGPRPRKYVQAMPKKMRRAALRSALSALVQDDQLVVVDKFVFDETRTRVADEALNNLTGRAKTLVLMAGSDEAVTRAVRNLDYARTLHAGYLNIRDLFSHDKVVMPLDALELIQSYLGTADAVSRATEEA